MGRISLISLFTTFISPALGKKYLKLKHKKMNFLNNFYKGEFYVNPVVDNNHPDPGVLKLPDGSGFVMVSTSNYAVEGDSPAFPIMYSSDLVNWEEVTVFGS